MNMAAIKPLCGGPDQKVLPGRELMYFEEVLKAIALLHPISCTMVRAHQGSRRA